MRQFVALVVAAVLGACGSKSSGQTPDACSDNDGDGQTDCDGDCDDNDPFVYTNFGEVCGDGKDNNCDGAIDDVCMGLGTWVSELAGDDANAGTQAAPVKTIAKGMANAAMIGGGHDVFIAGGHYSEKVVMVEGTDLYGGFECSALPCTWAYDRSANDSAILNVDGEGVVAGDGISRATKLDGLRVAGFDGAVAPVCAAISVRGSPTLSNNRIQGASLAGQNTSIGIALLAPTNGSALIVDNDITVGSSQGNAVGVMFTATQFPIAGPSVAEVRHNTIHGGSAATTSCIGGGSSGAGTLIVDNDIVTGTSTATNQARGGAWGVRAGGTMTIDANRINVPPATPGTCTAIDWCGGIQTDSATATITNNVVYGPSTPRSVAVRLREVEVAAGVVILNSNYLDGGGAGGTGTGTLSVSAAVQLEYQGCNNCGNNAIMGRIRNNILLGGKNTLRVGVLEADASMNRTNKPEALENNVFWFAAATGATDVLWRQWSGTSGTNITSIANVNAATNPAATGNQNADPLADASGHLMTGSPCIDMGTATESPAADMDGTARPAGNGPDIGADEL